MDASGNFVVTWSSDGQDGSQIGVYGQRFDASGNRQGNEFQVNTYTTEAQSNSSVAMDADGDFVVAWQSFRQGSNDHDIYAQRFDALGNNLGGEIQVNFGVRLEQNNPSVAMRPNGGFVVVWSDHSGQVSGRISYPTGKTLGRFRLTGAADQANPSVVMRTDGSFAVAYVGTGSTNAIRVAFFTPLGGRLASTINVFSDAPGNLNNPSIAMSPVGDTFVTWESSGPDGSSSGIFGQRFSAFVSRRGSEVQVNTYTTGAQVNSGFGSNILGDFVIAWQSENQDSSSDGIYARKYSRSKFSDFNRDRHADIFWREETTGQNTIWNMRRFSRLNTSGQQVVNTIWRPGGVGDINGDGFQDVVWRNTTTGANIAWLFQPGDSKVIAALPSVNTDWKMVGLGDIDGNGHQDVIWRNSVDGRNAAWRMDTTGGTLNVTAGNLNTVAANNWEIKGIGDVDNDDKADFIWRNQRDGKNIIWLMNDLDSNSVSLPVKGLAWDFAGMGDFDNNGRADIVWRDTLFGANEVWSLDGASVFRSALILTIPDQNWQVSQVADYSGDGKADILWRNSSTGQNSIFNMNGTEVQTFDLIPSVGNTNFKVQPED